MSLIEARMRQLGISLPNSYFVPKANAIQWRRSGNLIYLAGQGPQWDGEFVVKGRLGENCSIEDGQKAARICALNLVYFLRQACDGELDRAGNCIALQAFVRGTDSFDQQPAVVNGASDVLIELFGEQGRHTRVAIGVNGLPRDIPVEIGAIWEIAG